MNIYIQKDKPFHYDLDMMHLIFDSMDKEVYQFHDILKVPFEENSLFLPIGIVGLVEDIDNIQHIKAIKNKKLLIINHQKCFSNAEGINQIEHLATKYLPLLNFENKNIYIITQLNSDIKHFESFLKGANVIHYDRWLHQFFDRQISLSLNIYFNDIFTSDVRPSLENIEHKKFSIFIRRFQDIRFNFFCDLISKNLLNNFHYTFSNFQGSLTPDELKLNIPSRLNDNKTVIQDWINGIPYNVGNVHDEYSLELEKLYNFSKINIVYETHPIKDQSIITEKTYKAIWYKKPFLLVSQSHALKMLRENGYLTFNSCIDESYDDIEDYDLRVQAILNEIARLNNLPNSEFDQIIEKCKDIITHNFNVLINERNKNFPKSFTVTEMLRLE